MSFSLRAGIAALISGLVLAMCVSGIVGAASHRDRPHGILGACSYVPKKVARTALGQGVKSEDQTRVDEFSACRFEGHSTSKVWAFQMASNKMIRRFYHSGATAGTVFKTTRDFPGTNPQMVHGLGRQAFWTARFRQLWVLNGDLVMTSTGVDERRAGTVVKRILTRL